MEGVLVVEGGARTPSEHCPGTLEQSTKLPNAHIEFCDELGTRPKVDPPHDPDKDKMIKTT